MSGDPGPPDVWQTEHGYFFRRAVWEPLLLLLGAGAAWSFLGAGLCFSSLGGGEVRERRGPSRACRILMAPTVRMSPQIRVGASRGDSCFRTHWRAWARALLELRARRGLLSCGGRIEGGQQESSSLSAPPAWLAPSYLETKLPK